MMTAHHQNRSCNRKRARGGFTLVELLTVVFIISLLIGILIPSINSARTAAKKSSVRNTLRAIDAGLEMFRNDNSADFRQTNGYPPSYVHPPIRGYRFSSYLGEFPFLDPVSGSAPPQAYGAHWLPAMLIGADGLGYVKPGSVPSALKADPKCWYPNPNTDLRTCNNDRPTSMPFYIDPGGIRTVATKDIPGSPSETGGRLFRTWGTQSEPGTEALPVFLDAFEQPILYYAANTHGRESNMVEEIHEESNAAYVGGIQQDGPPFYFHQDNEGFTGTGDGLATLAGWNFGGVTPRTGERLHFLSESGGDYDATEIKANEKSFAAYILERQMARGLRASTTPNTLKKLKPVNAKSYLLITAGPDGRFGTSDDITNLPDKLE